MGDETTKKDPLELREERPPYVIDTSGPEDETADAPPAVGTDPSDASGAGDNDSEVHLDREQVRRADREGKGFR